jgi:hypothetical protein
MTASAEPRTTSGQAAYGQTTSRRIAIARKTRRSAWRSFRPYKPTNAEPGRGSRVDGDNSPVG